MPAGWKTCDTAIAERHRYEAKAVFSCPRVSRANVSGASKLDWKLEFDCSMSVFAFTNLCLSVFIRG